MGRDALNLGTSCHFRGAWAELYVAEQATKNNIIVSYPLFTQSKYDLVFDTKSGLYKIQVKKATKSSARGNEFIQIRLKSTTYKDTMLKYCENDLDFIAMVYEYKIWMLPYSFIKDHQSMSFSIFSSTYTKLDQYTFDTFIHKYNS